MKKIILLINILIFAGQINAQVWTALPQQPNDYLQGIYTDTLNNVLYVGGQLTAVGTLPCNHIAKWDGANWDSLGSGFDDRADCMVLYNGELYAGGMMIMSGTTPVSHIARWDGMSWQPVGQGINGWVTSLAVYNGELYAGGGFTQAGGNPANYIAKWDGSVWTPVGSGMDNFVYSLCVYNGELYAGGFFLNAGGNSAKRIAKWNGNTWSALGNGVNNGVRSIVEYNNNIYAAGDFTTASGTTVNHIAMWDGNQWSALGSGLDDYAYHLCVYNAELYVTGDFTASSTISLDGIGRWNGFGWSAPGTCTGDKNAMSVYGGDLYVTGSVLLGSLNCLVKWNVQPSFPPTAAFVASDSVIEAGSFVLFANQSTGASVTCTWSFPGGDPSASISANPIVNYPVPGIYPVTLIAANSAGTDTLTKTAYIHVSSVADPVSQGISTDYVQFLYDHTFYQSITPPANYEMDTCAYGMFEIYYYKPASYNPLSSPILWAVHGLGGNGSSTIGSLQAIADRREALIVSVTMQSDWAYDFISRSTQPSPGHFYNYFAWYTSIFKQFYKHVLHRESRTSVPVYLIGFSAGGQCVSRFMLNRQGIPDSIPIRMAVSTNPFAYTFCTDTFLNVPMYFPCGLLPGYTSVVTNSLFDCNEHVIQYYNENYGVLIGTGDIAAGSLFGCDAIQGNNRYERAQNFYAFSDSNAVTRGTVLQWPYVEIPGIGHDQYAMWNTKVNVTDSSTIAETLLFDTPYHTVPSLSPVADFYPDTTIININGTINFTNTSINASAWLWDFGDSLASMLTNPPHTYTQEGTYTVKLTASNGTGCSNTIAKKCYITVIDPNSVDLADADGSLVNIYPNPFRDIVKIKHASLKGNIIIRNIIGELVYEKELLPGKTEEELNLSFLHQGIYLMQVKINEKSYVKKIARMN